MNLRNLRRQADKIAAAQVDSGPLPVMIVSCDTGSGPVFVFALSRPAQRFERMEDARNALGSR